MNSVMAKSNETLEMLRKRNEELEKNRSNQEKENEYLRGQITDLQSVN
jgi:prefoldin subunit 5